MFMHILLFDLHIRSHGDAGDDTEDLKEEGSLLRAARDAVNRHSLFRKMDVHMGGGRLV